MNSGFGFLGRFTLSTQKNALEFLSEVVGGRKKGNRKSTVALLQGMLSSPRLVCGVDKHFSRVKEMARRASSLVI